ncbi:hypothetical protein ILUMI_07314 [Ignelater luminosus]|uniref:DUF4806 domain-containing protein n=1 Tax=Ignelater luminosus TaxID=2038154 RepID=A0A8K0D7N4_IGNLU|nr:hypothetical protein ILUMI_07314 [Ignelater luminosus]
MLDNILRNLEVINRVLERPADFPNLPVSNKTEYRCVEEFLSKDENFTYMTKRLSTIGGFNLRNTTMNMLKYLLTSQVAIKLNWSGKDKKPFKKTKMCCAIIDAVKLSYGASGPHTSDLSDKVIKESIQDWLKLAKSMYTYNVKKDT